MFFTTQLIFMLRFSRVENSGVTRTFIELMVIVLKAVLLMQAFVQNYHKTN
ncbi:MAG: hypothetical protein ACI9YO_002930 [Gammaproteobacteria bacterium]|jgi:hypothetical protein